MTDLIIDEKLKVEDNYSQQSRPNPETRNQFTIFNSKGKEVYRGFNLVVNKGRLLNLQNIFNINEDDTLSLHKVEKLWISCFSIGDGAAPLSNLSQPELPEFTDEELANKVPFYSNDINRINEDEDILKPKYWQNTNFKDFNSIIFRHDNTTQEMYAEITLRIGMSEALGKNINEIALYMAEHTVDSSNVILDKSNFKMFSRFTFASLPNSEFEGRDEYTIVYKVYV